ncbi:hypothetical protein ABZ379_43425 [Streptomyces canus]
MTGGQVDFVDALQGEGTRNDLSWHISDHFPLVFPSTAKPT